MQCLPHNMAITSSLILLFLSSLLIPSYSSSSINSFVYGGCSQQKYSPDSPYGNNINSLLTALVNSATYSSYNKYTVMGSSPQDILYGLYQCRGDMSMPDCATCVARAVSQVGKLCRQTCGGSLQLQGCYVKYDNVSFFGVEDKGVVFKKCGPSIGYDSGAMGLRDAVLSGLVRANGPFRVGGSGEVQGLGQCVGDLNTGQCQDCLSEAIGRVKSECPMGAYGDMFLGKCYARYSVAGAQAFTKGNNHEKSKLQNEKTFALIIGLLAGILLLIIFLTFMRKVFGGYGK